VISHQVSSRSPCSKTIEEVDLRFNRLGTSIASLDAGMRTHWERSIGMSLVKYCSPAAINGNTTVSIRGGM